MSSIDYSIFSKMKLSPPEVSDYSFDYFVSSFNDSERVQEVYSKTKANTKVWLVHPEYGYQVADLPSGIGVFGGSTGESPIEFWQDFFATLNLPTDVKAVSIGIDITGMMRPHLMVLPLMLRLQGFTRATMFYSDPVSYSSGDKTRFSKGPVDGVRVVPGMEGTHRSSTETGDVLIIGAGYDHSLVQAVAENKRSADHFLMLGLPSLQPHMYQESILRVGNAKESIRGYRHKTFLFAPASDPFVTAQVVSDHIKRVRFDGRADNVYLSPVGSKAQVLGFSWYFLCEARNTPTSMLFPFSKHYERETSLGISCVHKFEMELDMIPL